MLLMNTVWALNLQKALFITVRSPALFRICFEQNDIFAKESLLQLIWKGFQLIYTGWFLRVFKVTQYSHSFILCKM